MNAKVHSPKWNMITLAVVIIIGTILLVYGDYGERDPGMAMLVIVWIPLIFGVITAILYGLSRFIGKKYNWIITLIGMLIILYISIPLFFGAGA